MKATFFCVLLLLAGLAASAAPAATPASGPPGPQMITRDWWLAASEAQRETFVSASVEAYQTGTRDTYFAILTPLDNLLGSTKDSEGHAMLLRAVNVAKVATSPIVLFTKPASFYATEITRFYKIAPTSLQSMWPTAVLTCMADG